MEGILDIKSKYKASDLKFECFHNRGHPETCLLQKKAKDYNALQRIAVRSEEIADRVRDSSEAEKCSNSSRAITV